MRRSQSDEKARDQIHIFYRVILGLARFLARRETPVYEANLSALLPLPVL